MPITKTGKKKDGLTQYRVRVNYTDSLGKARQVERTAYGMDEAKQIEGALIAEYKDKKTAARLTVEELFKEYEEYHSHETRITTHEKTMRLLQRLVLPKIENYRLDKLTQPVLARWKNEMAATGYAIGTKRLVYKMFVAMLNYAVKMGYITKNPLKVLGNFKDPENFDKSAEKLRYYTPEQFLKYIAVARDSAVTCEEWGFYVFFSIAFYTGTRKGEIHALKWSDIDGDIITSGAA